MVQNIYILTKVFIKKTKLKFFVFIFLFSACEISQNVNENKLQITISPSKTSTENTDLSKMTNHQICGFATKEIDGSMQWKSSSNYQIYVNEAKSRNLKCKTKTKNEKQVVDLSKMPNLQICGFATKNINGNLQWETSPNYQIYVNEAKSRNLKCNIK